MTSYIQLLVSTACLLMVIGGWNGAAAQSEECSKCPVACDDGCVPLIDTQGCYKCFCPEADTLTACASVRCAYGTCVLREVVCVKAPCNPIAECQEVPASCSDVTPKCNDCPVECKAGCYPFVNSQGCYSCYCGVTDNTCQTVKCSSGYSCLLSEVQCIKAPCYPQPGCRQIPYGCDGALTTTESVVEQTTTGGCSDVMCMMYCEYGFAKDPKTGCPICSCFDPCQDIECQAPATCVPVLKGDSWTGVCSIECPLVKCPGDCKVVQDCHGCNHCVCGSSSCAATLCPKKTRCVMAKDPTCADCRSCPKTPQCIPIGRK